MVNLKAAESSAQLGATGALAERLVTFGSLVAAGWSRRIIVVFILKERKSIVLTCCHAEQLLM